MLFIPFLYIFARESNKPMKTAEEIRKEILKDFITFLKKHNAYIQYRSNIALALGFYTHDFIYHFYNGIVTKVLKDINGKDRLFNIQLAESLLNYAFTWSYTPEEDWFWRSLNREWVKYIEEKYNKKEIRQILEYI